MLFIDFLLTLYMYLFFNICYFWLIIFHSKSDALGGRDMIAIDSLDEARTHAVLGGASKDTIVTYLVEFRHQWPTW